MDDYMKIIRKVKKMKEGSALIPKGIYKTTTPKIFIDGNKNPIWDNNHSLLHKAIRDTCGQ